MYYDRRRRQAFYKPGGQVCVTQHPISKSQNKKSRKFRPKREGSYLVITNRSPTTYDIADPAKPDEVLGTYHSSALRAYELPVCRDSGTIVPVRRRADQRNIVLTLRRDVVRARGGVCNRTVFRARHIVAV
ncbi:hypothetical protein AVEN_68866-1 [Araneus ventricosus]|uniref:Uncharacterized protein n=1 Tax=Araneus ventricosus TaxID=182803 RepID=A0A4Y2C5J0_ARAVE|nr:hypothetical protein AVEN_68866-1 [Araneus ventricosus]